jgi:membrane protein DedA with SNARE-associated domain
MVDGPWHRELSMSVEELVQQYGYAIILLGSLVEGQPVMLFGGFAAHRGHLQLAPWVILAGTVGNFLCIQAWFLAGRKFGRPLIEKRPYWAARVEKVQGWLQRYESLLIVGIRFVAGASGVGSLAIGMTQVGTVRFTILNALGAFLWATSLAVAGYLLGNLLELVLEEVEAIEKPLLIGIVLVTVVWIVYRHLLAHRRQATVSAGTEQQDQP